MVRAGLFLALFAAVAAAHGGMFRPPPRGRPGDPFTPTGGRPGPITPGTRGGGSFTPWELWWHFNREPWLRTRQRIEERTVLSGERISRDPFDRTALRDMVLLPVMVEALSDPDEEVRTSAAVALGKFQARAEAPRLLDLFRRDRIKQVREAAMIGLMLLREPSLREFFRGAVMDEGETTRVRAFAVLALGLLGDGEFLAGVMEAKPARLPGGETTEEELRACAVLALGWTGQALHVPRLCAAALDDGAAVGVRGFAGSALARIDSILATPEMVRLVEDGEQEAVARVGSAIALGALVAPAEEGLLSLLGKKARRDRDGGVRTLLGMSLGRIGGELAAVEITAALQDCEATERGYFLLALGMARSRDSGAVLMEQFRSLRSGNDRGACALGLALAEHGDAVDLIRKECEDANPVFLPHGLVALGILYDTRSIPLVEKALAEANDPLVLREGALALALLRRAASIPALVKLLEGAHSTYLRGGIAYAIGLVGDKNAVDPLLKIYRDRTRQGEERAIALAALGRIGDNERIPTLAQLAYDINLYVISDAVGEILTIL